MRKVVITGIGMVTPCGNKKEEFWANAISGKSFITAFTDFPGYNLKSRVKGSVRDFNIPDYDSAKKEKEHLGRPAQLALAAARDAAADSGLVPGTFNSERAGTCIGNAIANTPLSEEQFLAIKDLLQPENCAGQEELTALIREHLFVKTMFSTITTDVAARFGLKACAFTMTTGCTSGIDALGYAWEAVRSGTADIMFCGAAEAPVTCMTIASFDVIAAMSRKNAVPAAASSPFDATRDGFVLAEGAGMVILEELEHALERGAHIYCEVPGFATTSNAHHMTDLPAHGEFLSRTIKLALEAAGISPGMISYINAHGSSTPQNDLFETAAYKAVCGANAGKMPVSSFKSVIGHPLGAASMIEIVLCCLIFEHNILPPTVNLHHPDPGCDLDYVPHKPRALDVKYILKTASGFSGIHSALVLKRYGICQDNKWHSDLQGEINKE